MASDSATDRTTVVYIAGAGRSGSTLLEQLLAERLNAVQVGELRMILAARRWGVSCECGVELRSCPLWSPIFESVFGDLDALASGRTEEAFRALTANRSIRRLLRGASTWSRRERDVSGRFARLYDAVRAATGGDVIIDSSKTPADGLMVSNESSIDLRVVHLVRDSRAVAYSWQRPKKWTGGGTGTMRTRSPAMSARNWMAHNAFSDLLVRQVAQAVTVRYEDFVVDPPGAVASIVGDLGLVPSVDPVHVSHGILGNPIRFDTTPRTIRIDDEWRRSLRRRDNALTTALTWPLLLRHGYPLLAQRDGAGPRAGTGGWRKVWDSNPW